MKQLFLIGFFIQIAVTQSLGQEQICSHAMSRCEKRHMADYLLEQHETALRNVPLPPPGKVRTMAEWEEIQALVITWAGQSTILKEIVRHAVHECKLQIITNNEANVASQ